MQVASATACGSTRRTANSCPAWRTWSAGCSKTPRTTRFLKHELRLTACAEDKLLAARSDSQRETRNGSGDNRNASSRPVPHGSAFRQLRSSSNESMADFSVAANRTAMTDALKKIAPQLGREYPAVIDNLPVKAHQRGSIP